jgi:adenylate kinase family enzyme
MKLQEIFKETSVDEGVNDPHIFKAVIMAGGPGSGKTYVAKKMLDGTGLRSVNSDDAFEFLMNKENLRKDMPPEEKEKRDQVRDRAKEITGKQEHLYMQGRLGLIIDGTGKNLDKLAKINERLKAAGYETKMLFVNSDLETSLQRNQDRFDKEGGRRVDPEIAKDTWEQVQKNMMMYQQIFGAKDFYIIDNSNGQEDDTKKDNFLFAWKEIRSWLEKETSNSIAQKWKHDNSVKRSPQQTGRISTRDERKKDNPSASPLSSPSSWGTSSQQAYKMKQASDLTQRAVKAKRQTKA